MTQKRRCHCDNGVWWAECCNGAHGCTCKGQPVMMGMCNVCNGRGFVDENSDPMANVKTINSGYIGTAKVRRLGE